MRYQDIPIFTTLPDDKLMGLCIEREAAGEPYEGRVAVGTVILERVDKHDWEGKTLQEVILKPWQFSWTMDQAGLAYYEEAVHMAQNFDDTLATYKALQECYDIARGMLDGAIPRDPDLHASHCCQYLNPKTAAVTMQKWLDHGMKVVKVIGHHTFFMT